MAKKKEVVQEQPKQFQVSENGHKVISENDYWKWRVDIAEVQLAKAKVIEAEQRLQLMAKDLEIARLNAAIFKQSIKELKDAQESAKAEYERNKKELEVKYEVSLEKAVINDRLEIVILE